MNFDTHITAYLSERVKQADRFVDRAAKFAVVVAIIVGLLVLAGCGGGGGGSGKANPYCTKRDMPFSYNATFIAYGDSTMEAAGARLQSSLADKGVFITFQNRAINGSRLEHLLNATCSYVNALDTEMMALFAAKYVSENYGINEVNNNLTEAQYEADLRQFVDTVRKYGKVPIIITPNPVFAGQHYTQEKVETLGRFADIAVEVACDTNSVLVDVHRHFLNQVTPADYTDGIHPNASLYQRIADYEAEVLAPLITQ